jgi:hypothetical protein
MLYAAICYALLPAAESALKATLLAALNKGADFERTLIRPNKTLEVVGSTRIGNGDLTPSGAPKAVNYFDAVEAFTYAGQLADVTANKTAARDLAAGQGWVAPDLVPT